MAQFVLMMVLVVAGIGGFIFVVWWSVRRARRKPQIDDFSSCGSSCDESLRETEPSEINFEIESVCGGADDMFGEARNGTAYAEVYNVDVRNKSRHGSCETAQHI